MVAMWVLIKDQPDPTFETYLHEHGSLVVKEFHTERKTTKDPTEMLKCDEVLEECEKEEGHV